MAREWRSASGVLMLSKVDSDGRQVTKWVSPTHKCTLKLVSEKTKHGLVITRILGWQPLIGLSVVKKGATTTIEYDGEPISPTDLLRVKNTEVYLEGENILPFHWEGSPGFISTADIARYVRLEVANLGQASDKQFTLEDIDAFIDGMKK